MMFTKAQALNLYTALIIKAKKTTQIKDVSTNWWERIKLFQFDERVFIVKNIRFVLFLSVLALCYIANTHYAERNLREVNRLQKNLKELRWQYTNIQSNLMYNSKQTEVAKRVGALGLEELIEPPKKLVVRIE